MRCEEIITKYIEGLKEEFHCIPGAKRLRIITPYVYADNDLIEVFVEDIGKNRIRATDLGETFRHLHSQGFEVFSSATRKSLAQTIASRVNVEMSGGTLIRIGGIDEVHEVLFDLITASRGIGDLIYRAKTYEAGTFFDEVKGFLEKNQLKYDPKITIKGKTNKSYRIHFRVLDGKPSYLQTLSPKSIYTVKGIVDATVRMWFDLADGTKKISLLNDIVLRWREPDILILKTLSTVSLWSRKDRLMTELS